MPQDVKRLWQDIVTANRALASAEIAKRLNLVILQDALPDELPGLKRALEIVAEYRDGKPDEH